MHPALRSLHLQHSRARGPQFKVKSPPHILYYHVITPDVVEIVRVLHEHMDPRRHYANRLKSRIERDHVVFFFWPIS